jgi:hypothetical protein
MPCADFKTNRERKKDVLEGETIAGSGRGDVEDCCFGKMSQV